MNNFANIAGKVILTMLFLTGLIFLPQSISAQNTYFCCPGELYNEMGFRYVGANRLLHKSEPFHELPRTVTDLTVYGYWKYGVAPDMTFTVEVPYKLLFTGNRYWDLPDIDDPIESGSLRTLGNIKLGINKDLTYYSPFTLGVGFVLELPTAIHDEVTGLRSGYPGTGLGGVVLFDTRSDFIHLSAYTGGIIRGIGPSQRSGFAYYGHLETGINYQDLFYLIVQAKFQRMATESAAMHIRSYQTGWYVLDEEYTSWGVKILGHIDPNIGTGASIMFAADGHYYPRGPFVEAFINFRAGKRRCRFVPSQL